MSSSSSSTARPMVMVMGERTPLSSYHHDSVAASLAPSVEHLEPLKESSSSSSSWSSSSWWSCTRSLLAVFVVLGSLASLASFIYHRTHASIVMPHLFPTTTTTTTTTTTVAVDRSALVNSSSHGDSIAMWTSQQDPPLRLARAPIDLQWIEDFSAEVTVTILEQEKHQSMFGFGGAITEAATITMSKLKPELVDEIVEAYYGKSGHRYSVARLPINSCDFSPTSYNFADVPDDFGLKHFDDNVTHDTVTQIPFIRRAIDAADGRLRIFASPWSAPGWMKVNGQMTDSASPGGLKPEPEYQRVWAKYISRWISAYKRHGVNIWGVTPQNEPEYAAPWEAMKYTAELERDFIRDSLGPILEKEHPGVNIIAFDHNKDHVKIWADIIFSDEAASKYVWGLGVHWYSGDAFDNMAATAKAWPKKHLIGSEACNCPGVLLGDWNRAEAYAHDIIGDINAGAEGWTDWNIVLDQTGGPNHLGNNCDAPIIANLESQTLSYQPSYYALGHFARFVPRDSLRLGMHIDNAPLMEAVAFLTPSGDRVLVAINRWWKPAIFKLRTSSKSGKAAKIELPGHSFVTLQF